MPSVPEPGKIAGDYGLGLCSACCQLYASGKRKQPPEFAITWIPVPGPVILVLPSCYEHIKQMSKGPGLITPNQSLS